MPRVRTAANMKVAVAIFAAFVACAFANEDGYQPSIYGMQGLKLFCDTEQEVELVRAYEQSRGFDFVRLPRNRSLPVEVFVAGEQLVGFKRVLAAAGIRHEVHVENVAELVEQQREIQHLAQLTGAPEDILKSFPRYDEICSYIESLAKKRSDIVTLLNFGKTYEGRDILGVKISSGGAGKPAMLIDAGIHAREWIAPTTVIYAIKQLAENASNSHVFANVDIYIIPSINPDGYEYSHASSSNRLWRKNRSQHSSTGCFGTDINRNFDYDWERVRDTCSITYGGPEPFSELESIALKDFILAHKDVLKTYVSFHSYGNYFLHPWGAKPELPKNAPKLQCAAEKAEAELSKVRGTHFDIGSSYNLLYAVYGGSKDWILGTAGLDLAYTVELPSDQYGFLAPVSEILPVGRETFEAIKVFAKYTEGGICQDV